MTRRTRGLDLVNAAPDAWQLLRCGELLGKFSATFQQGDEQRTIFCPYGRVGDRLWVRETWNAVNMRGVFWHQMPRSERIGERWIPIYRVDETPGEWGHYEGPYVPSIHMPRWASRTNLIITSLAIERVQDISEADARREGVTHYRKNLASIGGFRNYATALHNLPTARESFRTLICSINGDAIWTRNEWCWCIGFKVVGQ